MTETNQVIHGDCMDVMREMEDNSIDTIITDPPYHLGSISKRFAKASLADDNDTAANARNGSNQYARLSTGFMGKSWDGGGIAFQPELWAEMLRVAKPGAMLLAFGGTRTHHRLMVAIEDAGWEIRDCISHFHAADSREVDLLDSMTDDQRQAYFELHYPNRNCYWTYGSGFPKSLSIGKAIDKATITDCSNCDGKGFVMPELPSYEELVAEDPDNHITYEDWLYSQTPEGIIARQYKCSDCNGTGKVKGKEREVVGTKEGAFLKKSNAFADKAINGTNYNVPITAPATEAAKTFDGYGTGLKPAVEPIILAQAPIEKNYANNAQVWGVAGLNIDGSRISTQDDLSGGQYSGTERQNGAVYGNHRNLSPEQYQQPSGRWPSNVLLSHAEGCVRRGEKRVRGITGGKEPKRSEDSNTLAKGFGANGRQSTYVDYADPNGLETVADWECVEGCPIRILDEQAGVRKSGGIDKRNRETKRRNSDIALLAYEKPVDYTRESSIGSASRFFYTAKAPNREKWFYCQLCQAAYPNKERDDHGHDIPKDQRKHIVAHPTVKPQSILEYLCTLTKTPTGGIVLDPFAGSGTTALACLETGRDFILIEKEADYYEIAKARVEAAMNEPKQAELW